MTRMATLVLPAGAAVLALTGAGPRSVLADVQPGLWEISGAPGAHTPVRQCLGDMRILTRFEHRNRNCTAHVLKDEGSAISLDYSCGGAGFGHSEVEVITPRSLRIATQGISSGQPFNYVLQARRVADCAKSATVIRH